MEKVVVSVILADDKIAASVFAATVVDVVDFSPFRQWPSESLFGNQDVFPRPVTGAIWRRDVDRHVSASILVILPASRSRTIRNASLVRHD